MKFLLLLPLLVLGARGSYYATVYSGQSQTGSFVAFTNDIYFTHDLSTVGLDNDLESVRQTGLWLYYENTDYEAGNSGTVLYVMGIDYEGNFDANFQNTVSSLHCSSCPSTQNEDMITFYEGNAFQGSYYQTTTDNSILGALVGTVSSITVTGTSVWTVYTGTGYTGSAVCVYANLHYDGSDGSTLDVGVIPSVVDIGLPDNSIVSVSKGCHATRTAEAPKLQMEDRQENGAWGRLV